MITKLQRLETKLKIIQEIPELFFSEIEDSTSFGDHLFPGWTNAVFRATSLKQKFELVYNKYKSIKTKTTREKIINSFVHSNQIENLCNNQTGLLIIELKELPKKIRKELDNLFLYLYNTALNYHIFETHVSETLKESIDAFILNNELEVCPLCGIEGFLNLEGQSRIALDHWLCKDLFPMASVNFNNLFPIGAKCNERPAKGTKNILWDNNSPKNRVKAYYPYMNHSGISTSFNFINEPSIAGIKDEDWEFKLDPTNPLEIEIFNSWDATLNIKTRYLGYLRKNIFLMWENRYKRYIEKHPHLEHANSIDELKTNFEHWKSTFDLKAVAGSIVYIPFIDFLINNASDAYLFGLYQNLRR